MPLESHGFKLLFIFLLTMEKKGKAKERKMIFFPCLINHGKPKERDKDSFSLVWLSMENPREK